MKWLNTNPYPGAVAVTCDLCNKDIAIAYSIITATPASLTSAKPAAVQERDDQMEFT